MSRLPKKRFVMIVTILLMTAGAACTIRSRQLASIAADSNRPAHDRPARPGGCAAVGTSALWADFVEATQEGREPILPDFSYAGYHYSERPLPDPLPGPVFNVTDYGAVADDGNYDDAAIQAAIDAAANTGGGVVFFPPGQFMVSPNTSPDEFIRITSSNIVLKGIGSADGGT